LPVYAEANMGGNRCGVEPSEPALDSRAHLPLVRASPLAFATELTGVGR